MADGLRRHRITVDEYYRMAAVGLLAPDARVELIKGVIVDMPPMGARHAAVVTRLHKLLERAAGDLALVRCQLPLRLDAFSEPQPDIALLRPREDFYEQRHPTAADALLVVEVSETRLRYDTRAKAALYARHGVPELWIIDSGRRQLHILRNPAEGAYSSHIIPAEGLSSLTLTALPSVSVDLSWLAA
ncbi:MAG: Uma2 family endonuclease [Steroidobacteraceae bacterium]|nr:Uma2 family endonuclease [Steroidobacteraceae bacterium]